MKVLSLFSGAGGMDLGLEQAGHTITAMCEIDPHARSVLQHHWPDTPIYEDVTTFDATPYRGTIDVVSGGSPCQNLSVAGKREGLGGSASSLFWHQCRIANQTETPWVIWENVAGALNSNNGMDFAAVLWGLTGFAPTVPKNGWRKMGVCVGPQRTAIWRLFDAQWFGVPQRRRRIFIVAGPRNLCEPEILFDCESLFGDPPTRQQQTENAPTPTDGSIANNDQQTATYWDGGQIADTVDVSMAVKGQMLPEKRRMFAVIEPYVKSSRARSSDGYETWVEGEVNPTLNVFDMGDTRATTVIASFDSTWSGAYPMHNGDVSPPVKVGSTLGIASPPAIATDLTVRRLTPIECERLMGWPDNWTATGTSGPLSDSQRYKMCGNGVVAPITKWIGQRLP
jgi:DNA (cytosine-5)-methyltransferase 1